MSQVRPLGPQINTFEDVLQKTGWGIYYKFLVGFACVSSIVNGLTVLNLYLVIPLSSCDTLLTPAQLMSLHVFYAVGRSCGGLFLLCISDAYGKKCMITKTQLLNFGCCFLIGFSHNAYTMYFSSFFLGSGMQASTACLKIFLAEILPMRKRGFYLVLVDVFTTLGYFCSYLGVWLIVNTSHIEHHGTDMKVISWRVIFAFTGGLSITMGCSSALLEMSPRFLLFKKRVLGASLLLKQFYAVNRSKYSETFGVKHQDLHGLVMDYDVGGIPEPNGVIANVIYVCRIMGRMCRFLMSGRFFPVIFMASLLKLLGLTEIVPMNLLMANLLDGFDNKTTLTGDEALKLSRARWKGLNCTLDFDQNSFHYGLLLMTQVFVTQLIMLLLIDKVGRKFLIWFGLFCCTSSSFVMAFLTKHFITSAVSASFYLLGGILLYSATDVFIIESVPTAVRGFAYAKTSICGLLVMCAFNRFVNMPLKIYFLIMGVYTLGLSLITVYFVRERRSRPMME